MVRISATERRTSHFQRPVTRCEDSELDGRDSSPVEAGLGASGEGAAVPVGDGQAAILAEGLGRNLYARRRLASLVLVAIDHGDDAPHDVGRIAGGHDV